jgi:hypothetical protein
MSAALSIRISAAAQRGAAHAQASLPILTRPEHG